ncbi:hypothetical protein CUJ84_Chr002344 [Rhizobium leguminosarum]|uniref:Uncharacterized protein n=1 Tax=Rhizobium leguminosarum TaxID=384 RepID=A0A2K9Z3E0_RHILE|nr:hypothetical protein CUJ84_Chr002344 [Rhizobium leguminosarum]
MVKPFADPARYFWGIERFYFKPAVLVSCVNAHRVNLDSCDAL